MVSIRTLLEDKSSSTSSSTGSVPTEVLHPEDEDYDLDLPSSPPRGSPASQSFNLGEETWFSTSVMTNQLLTEKLTNRDNNKNSATPTVPNDEQTRNDSSPT